MKNDVLKMSTTDQHDIVITASAKGNQFIKSRKINVEKVIQRINKYTTLNFLFFMKRNVPKDIAVKNGIRYEYKRKEIEI